jgi:hypothetical protein
MIVVMVMIVFKLVVNSQDIPTLHCKEDSALPHPYDWTQQSVGWPEREENFPRKNSKKAALADAVPR